MKNVVYINLFLNLGYKYINIRECICINTLLKMMTEFLIFLFT